MKAISLWQPWASLVPAGAKPVETRSWSTSYRGPLAIHAAKTTDGFDELPGDCEGDTEAGWRYGYIGDFQAGYCFRSSDEGTRGEAFLQDLISGAVDESTSIPLGAVVATCNLVAVVPTESIRWFDDKWGPDSTRFGWRLLEVIRDEPPTAFVCESVRPYGDFGPNRYAWLLDDIEAVAEPVPARGRQGLWEWTP